MEGWRNSILSCTNHNLSLLSKERRVLFAIQLMEIISAFKNKEGLSLSTIIYVAIIFFIIFIVGQSIGNFLFFRNKYPSYKEKRKSLGLNYSFARFIITYASVLDPSSWLQARQEKGFGLKSLLTALIIVSLMTIFIVYI